MGNDVELKVSFRFLSLSHAQASELQTSFSAADFGKHFKSGELTAALDLGCVDLGALSKFIRANAIEVDATDIFISLVSEHDSHIVDVPPCVHAAIREIGSKLVISYTVV